MMFPVSGPGLLCGLAVGTARFEKAAGTLTYSLFVLQDRAAPGQAAAKADAGQKLARLQLPVLGKLVQGYRDAGGTGVAVAVHVLVELCRVGLQRPHAVVDDAAVGLMADHPLKIIEGQLRFIQHSVQALGQGIHCKAEYGLAVHGDGRGTCAVRPARMENIAAARAQRQSKGSVRQLKNGSTGSIPKQYTGGAVGGVHQAGKCFAPDDEGILPAQSRQHSPRHGHAIEKTGTGRVDVQRGPVFGQAQRRLYLTGHAGGGIRGRQGGAHAAGDVCRGKAAALQRLLCGSNGKGGSGFVLAAPVPGTDAGAGGDPLVAGVHDAAQIFVGDRAAGQCPAGCDQL